mmetsp:Transcript_2217/g.7024  ORF Transcript_2217/g.7024 Transcript_2217/m.7024 type:complete len:556 (+) Transcript_2217:1317-2984(+)
MVDIFGLCLDLLGSEHERWGDPFQQRHSTLTFQCSLSAQRFVHVGAVSFQDVFQGVQSTVDIVQLFVHLHTALAIQRLVEHLNCGGQHGGQKHVHLIQGGGNVLAQQRVFRGLGEGGGMVAQGLLTVGEPMRPHGSVLSVGPSGSSGQCAHIHALLLQIRERLGSGLAQHASQRLLGGMRVVPHALALGGQRQVVIVRVCVQRCDQPLQLGGLLGETLLPRRIVGVTRSRRRQRAQPILKLAHLGGAGAHRLVILVLGRTLQRRQLQRLELTHRVQLGGVGATPAAAHCSQQRVECVLGALRSSLELLARTPVLRMLEHLQRRGGVHGQHAIQVGERFRDLVPAIRAGTERGLGVGDLLHAPVGRVDVLRRAGHVSGVAVACRLLYVVQTAFLRARQRSQLRARAAHRVLELVQRTQQLVVGQMVGGEQLRVLDVLHRGGGVLQVWRQQRLDAVHRSRDRLSLLGAVCVARRLVGTLLQRHLVLADVVHECVGTICFAVLHCATQLLQCVALTLTARHCILVPQVCGTAALAQHAVSVAQLCLPRCRILAQLHAV